MERQDALHSQNTERDVGLQGCDTLSCYFELDANDEADNGSARILNEIVPRLA